MSIPLPCQAYSCLGWTYWTVNLVKKNPIVKSHYPVWNSSPGGVGLLSRHGRNHSVSRILKTLVHRRCEFSMPISDHSAHKFSIKTNCAYPQKKKPSMKRGAHVFDVWRFDWDEAATPRRSVLTARWFPAVKGDSRAMLRTPDFL